jgi:hypothetical protein
MTTTCDSDDQRAGPDPAPVDRRRILALWAPLAASWLLMGIEMPLFAAVVARLPDAEVHLAAFSAAVYPFALLIEAPIIMLLAASTAWVGDLATWRRLRNFVQAAGGVLTIVHLAVAFTPLFDLVVRDAIRAPDEVLEPARLGLRILTPWTWAIAYRRFQQGVLIRFEHARLLVVGTVVRLASNAALLVLGVAHGGISGIVVGTAGIAVGVVAEALFAGFCVQRYCRPALRRAAPPAEPFRWGAFFGFYLPLAATPFLTLLVQPLGAAAMNRMPEPITSLAAWSPVYGLVFLTRSAGFAFNEVVVTLVQRPGGLPALRRFAWGLGVSMMGLLALLAFTPLGGWWFGTVSGLSDDLVGVAAAALGLAVLMPGYAVLQSLYQGALVRARRTRAVTEAVALYLLIAASLLAAGVALAPARGIEVALCAFTLAGLAQTGWLWLRSSGGAVAGGPARGAADQAAKSRSSA